MRGSPVGAAALALALASSAPGDARAQTLREKMEQGLALAQSGQAEKAEALFREIIEENPRHGPARLQLGQITLDRGDLDEAQIHLEIATASDPARLYLAWHLLGRVYALKENYPKARHAFQESLKRAPNFVPPRLFLAEIAERQGRLWEALAGYKEILRGSPDSPDVNAQLAHLARIMGAYDLAESAARAALKARPDDGSLHYLLALIFNDRGQADASLESCQKAIDLGFQEAPVYVTLGNLLYAKMEISRSIAALGKAVEIDPAAAESIASFALTSLTTEDFASLRTILEKHLEVTPDNVNTLYSLGAMYLRENDLEKAKECFLRLETLVPDQSQVYYNLGMICLRQGREQEGQAAMARFQELKAKENETWAKQNQAHVKRQQARDAISGGDFETAIRLYSELDHDGTAEVADRIALAKACLAAGRHDEAYTWSEKLLLAAPFDREALGAMAEAAEALGKKEIAEECRERLSLLSVPEPRTPEARDPSERLWTPGTYVAYDIHSCGSFNHNLMC